MNFKSQAFAIEQLDNLAQTKRQSVMIEGPSGCGKTHLAKYYGTLLEVDDFVIVEPKVASVQEAIQQSTLNDNIIMLCIENLDTGVLGAAYALLKFLEEPLPNVYIVVTCRNISNVPDTIISRSTVVNITPPIVSDIVEYAKNQDSQVYDRVKDRLVTQCCNSFGDIDSVLKMNSSQIDYYDSIAEMCKFKDSISNLVWKISHYQDNSPCNIELAVRCIMRIVNTPFCTKCCIDCLKDLNTNRMAAHSILACLMFNLKYCE